MNIYRKEIEFPINTVPDDSNLVEIRKGIFWARMQIPNPLNHVNVYIFEVKFVQKNGISLFLILSKGHFTKVYSNKGCEPQNFPGIL